MGVVISKQIDIPETTLGIIAIVGEIGTGRTEIGTEAGQVTEIETATGIRTGRDLHDGTGHVSETGGEVGHVSEVGSETGEVEIGEEDKKTAT